MTEHQDDNILDDDVEEHDFNFDNEKEDALLAETELDEFLEKTTNEKRRISPIQGRIRSNSVITQDAEQLDQEDVLDIVIAEEDIVETETVCLSNIHDIGIRVPQCDHKANKEVTEKNSVPFSETIDAQNPKIETEHESGDVEKAKNETLATNTDDGCTTAGSNERSNEKNEIKDMGKSSVISLKTNIKKSYDDLPDLAKVIELVQPSSSSRHRKHTKTFQHYFAKKKRSNDMLNVTRNDENFIKHNNFKDVKYGSINETSHNNERRDGTKNAKQSYHLSAKNNNEIYGEEIGHMQKVTSEDSFRDIVSEVRNFPMQPLLASKEIRDERSVLTTVQITEKRYQIASDFRIIRPSLRNPALNYVPENINYSDVNPFPMPKSGGPFHSATTLSTSNTNIASHSPASQFSNCDYHTNVENRSLPSILPVNFNNYGPPSVDICPPPPVSFPQNCLPSLRVNQRMPQISSPLPFHSPPHPSQPLSNSFHHQQSYVFLPPYAPHHSFPANASFEGSNNDPASLTTSVKIHNLSSLDRLPYSPRHHHRSYSASHATPINPINTPQVSFPNFRPPPPLIQMPPPQNFFANSRSINNQQSCTVARSVDYYAEKNLLSFSPSSMNMSTLCGSEASSQPPPPGVLTSHSPPSNVFSDGKVSVHSYVRSNRLEPTHFDKGVNFGNNAFSQPNEKYPHVFNEQRRMHDEAIPNDRNLDIHPSKRIASTSVDTVSNGNCRKQLRLNHSNIAQDQDYDDMEVYRKKVEQQKELREQFIQMKEEQRLKNQMQNFIQSNIKGILQKREQFLKKKEEENTFACNSSVKDRENDHSIMTDRKRNQCGRINKDRSNRITLPTERKESPHSLDTAHTFSKDNKQTDTRQLHKVIKIKYKDGTVALKSFPVCDAANIKASFDEKSSFLNNLNVTIQDENVTASGANPRRMVVSKQISPRIEPRSEDKLSSRNENIIVESVRKGVTQSSVPLAQRFSNLKCNAPENTPKKTSFSSSSINR